MNRLRRASLSGKTEAYEDILRPWLEKPAEMIHYGMTKTAQVAVARGLAESVAETGVTRELGSGGPDGVGRCRQFPSRAWRNNKTFRKPKVEKQFFETIRPTSLLKRFESTEEVASVVAFVASTQAVAINGAAVRAEGGVSSQHFLNFDHGHNGGSPCRPARDVRERIAATSISGHCDRPHLIDIVAASSHTKGTHESVCGPPKWKLENGAQRPVPETRPRPAPRPGRGRPRFLHRPN